MTKPNIDATDVIKFAIALAVAAVGAALYIPSVAQQAVVDHATQVEAPAEKRQDTRLEKVEVKVEQVREQQIKLGVELTNTQAKLDETNAKIDALLRELRRKRGR